VALNTIKETNKLTNFCMNLGDIKQHSKYKTDFEDILNSKKGIAMKPDMIVAMTMDNNNIL
jgi:hypothetical protein